MTTTTLQATREVTLPAADQFDVYQFGVDEPHRTDFRCESIHERLTLHGTGEHTYAVILRGGRLLAPRKSDGIRRVHATWRCMMAIRWPADTPLREGRLQRWQEYSDRLALYIEGPELLWDALRDRLRDADPFVMSVSVLP